MPQDSYNLPNSSGAAFRQNLNNALGAIQSVNSGNQVPNDTSKYMYWIDENVSSSDLPLLKQRNKDDDGNILLAEINGQSYFSSGTADKPGISFRDDKDCGMQRNTANKISLVTNGTNRLTIDGTGQVGIGETGPTELLHVAGNIKTTGNITSGTPDLGQSGFEFQNSGVHKVARDTAADNSVLKVMGNSGATGGELRIKGDGDCANTNGNYDPITSDERLKENIVDASSQWEDIKGIRFRNFNYISKPNTRILGCVAQELQQVCPSLIKTRPASEEEIADNSNTISEGDQVLSFKQIPLLFKAAKALQEAMERIETLEAKVAALEAGN